jgi:hypothetical protein
MNDRNRVGPYTVRRRFRGLGPGSGRVYEAVRADSGARVVLVSAGPGEEWKPAADLDVRVSADGERGFLALESASGRDVNLPELTLALHRLAATTARLEGRPDAAAHLTGQQVARRQRRPRRYRWVLWTMLVGGVAALVAVPLCAERQAEGPAATVAVDVPELLDAGVMSDGLGDMGERTGGALPAKPFKNQKRPPCNPNVEVERNGGCWMVLKVAPPCPVEVYQSGSECVTPVLAAPRLPTSIEP